MIPENIHIYTMDGFLEFYWQEGFFEPKIQRHGVILTMKIPREWGEGFLEGTDKCANAKTN